MNKKLACQKYMVSRAVEGPLLAEFVKWGITSIFKNNGSRKGREDAAWQDAIEEFCSFWNEPGNFTLFPSSVRENDQILCNNQRYSLIDLAGQILSDDSIRVPNTCLKLWRTAFEGREACCDLCLFGGCGKNANMAAELEVLRYVAESKEHLKQFQDAGGKTSFFRSCVDIGEDLPFSRPYVFPAFARYYNDMEQMADKFYEKPTLEARLLKSGRLANVVMQEVQRNMPNSASDPDFSRFINEKQSLFRKFSRMILNADEINENGMKQRVSDYLAREQKILNRKKGARKVPVTAENEAEVPPENPLSSPTVPAKKPIPESGEIKEININHEKSALDTPETPSLGRKLCENILSQIDAHDAINDTANSHNMGKSEDIIDQNIILSSSSLTTNDGNINHDPEIMISKSGVINAKNNSDLAMSTEKDAAFSAETARVDASGPLPAPVQEENHTGGQPSDVILLPKIPKDVLYRLKPFKECASEVFAYTAECGMLPIEVVMRGDTAYFYLIWMARGRYFTYCPVLDMPPEMILLLRKKSIVKICWQSYYMHAVSRAAGINVETVHSIFSVDLALNPSARPCAYEDLVRYYAAVLRGEPIARKEMEPSLYSLYNAMPYYSEVFHVQKREARLSESDYNDLSSFDTVLGISYLLKLNFESDNKSFEIAPNGTLTFHQFDGMPVKRQGHLITYAINKEDIPDHSAYNLFKNALIYLEQSGRCRKINLQLLFMDENILHLFVAEKYHTYLSTVLQNFFNKWAVQNDVERFALIVNHKPVIGNNTSALRLPSGKLIDKSLVDRMAKLVAKRRCVDPDSYKAKGIFELRGRNKHSRDVVIPFGNH